MKKYLCLMLIFVLASVMSVSAFAETMKYKTEVINEIGLGDISISLKEYMFDEHGDRMPYEMQQAVLPGQRIDRMIQIKNNANPAWVRVKMEYISKDGICGMNKQFLEVETDGWLPIGEYWYYQYPLEKNETVEFINEMIIPPEWDASYSEKSFSVIVTAEAVQKQNFIPDFNSEDPWFGTVIETCVHSDYETEVIKPQNFTISFEGGAEGLIKTDDDFFSNWGNLMPGDQVSDHVVLKNTYHRPVKIYFKTETIADDSLLKTLRLQIIGDDTVLYDGAMDGVIKEYIEIAKLNPGDEKQLVYTVTVPKELTNQYATAETQTKWVFAAQIQRTGTSGGYSGYESVFPNPDIVDIPNVKEEFPIPTPPSGFQNPFDDNQKNVVESIKDWIQKHIPHTGDSNIDVIAGSVALISAAGILVLYVTGKKRRKK